MNSSIDLTEKNIVLYSMHEYHSPSLNSIDEFIEDLQHIKFIKRLFSRYENSGKINSALVLNRIVCLHNVFRLEALCRLLFFHVEEKHWSILKPFLIFLDYLQEEIPMIRGKNIKTVEIPLDQNIINILRNVK